SRGVFVLGTDRVDPRTGSEQLVDGDALADPERSLVQHRARLALPPCLEAVGALVGYRHGYSATPHLTSEAHGHVLARDGATARLHVRVLLVDEDGRL